MDAIFAPDDIDDYSHSWADRSEYWLNAYDDKIPRRKRRERQKRPLILCGHGMSIRVNKNTILIKDGNTHFPSKKREWCFFKGDLDLPPRIVVIEGSGHITFDAIEWLSVQKVPLVWLKCDGTTSSIASPSGNSADADKVRWQRQTADDAKKRLAFAVQIIREKLLSSQDTLIAFIPESSKRTQAIEVIKQNLQSLQKGTARNISDVLGIEGRAASAYFGVWQTLPIRWKSIKRYPIPEEWTCFRSRSSLTTGIKPKNYNASHPTNAMLNYGYAILERTLLIEAVADGYDPTIGIMHNSERGSPAYVFDLMEPKRPIVDRAVLSLIENETFSGRDFMIQDNGACRLNPELARRVVQLVTETL